MLPAAVVFVIGGLLACFSGYRLFRLVLGIYGFILGALITTSAMGTSSHLALAVAAIVGGLVGAALMFAAYFIGVALVGAAFATMLVAYAWKPFHGEPAWFIIVGVAIVGALVALWLTRYVVIVATAFFGAWTLIVGGLALAGDRAAVEAASQGNVFIVYPLDATGGRWWLAALWIVLSCCGVIAQLALTSKSGGAKRRSKPRADT